MCNNIRTRLAGCISSVRSCANGSIQAVSTKVDALKISIPTKIVAAKAQLNSAGTTAYSALTSSVTKKGVKAFILVALAGSFTAAAIMMLNELRSKAAPKGIAKAPTEQLSMEKLNKTVKKVLSKKEYRIALRGSALCGAFVAGCVAYKEHRAQAAAAAAVAAAAQAAQAAQAQAAQAEAAAGAPAAAAAAAAVARAAAQAADVAAEYAPSTLYLAAALAAKKPKPGSASSSNQLETLRKEPKKKGDRNKRTPKGQSNSGQKRASEAPSQDLLNPIRKS